MIKCSNKEEIKEVIRDTMQKHNFTLKEARMFLCDVLTKAGVNWNIFQEAYSEMKVSV